LTSLPSRSRLAKTGGFLEFEGCDAGAALFGLFGLGLGLWCRLGLGLGLLLGGGLRLLAGRPDEGSAEGDEDDPGRTIHGARPPDEAPERTRQVEASADKTADGCHIRDPPTAEIDGTPGGATAR